MTRHTAPTPPLPSTAGVFRAQLRTTFHGWGLGDTVWTLLFALALLGLTIRPFEPPRPGHLLPLTGGPGWAHATGLLLALLAASKLWGGTRPEETEAGRRVLLAVPLDRRRQALLRLGAAMVWVLGITGVCLALGALGERLNAGTLAAAPPSTWLALWLSPLLVVLLIGSRTFRTGDQDWLVLGILVLVGLLATPFVVQLPEEAGIAYALFHGPLGVVTALTGGSLAAVLIWGALFGVLLYTRAGRLAAHREPEGASRHEPNARPEPRTHLPAGGWRAAGAGVGAAAWGGLPAPVRVFGSRLGVELRALADTYAPRDVAGVALFSVFLGTVMAGDAGFFDFGAHLETLGTRPLAVGHTALIFLTAMGMLYEHRRLAPGAFHQLGAFPGSRRTWVLGRIAASGAVLGALAVSAMGGLWLVHLTTGAVPGPTPAEALNTLGLVALFLLMAGTLVAAFDSGLAVFLAPWVTIPVPPLVVGAAVLTATGDRFETAEVLGTLFLIPALVGRPHLGTLLALALWISVAGAALWVAAGVRHSPDQR